MTRIEFGDYYKFVASLGLVLIALAFAMPWLYVTELPALLSTSENIATVAPEITTILGVITFKHVLLTSGVVLLAGTVLTTWGLRRWYKKQFLMDTRDRLELDQLEKDVKPMGALDIRTKTLAEFEAESQSAFDIDKLLKEPGVLERLSAT